mmetsp:Transcript_29605/g.62244  ORF Transcript_29605/g.62244 Transcript_29605/m.62244 type:complete len:305 (+) Transcript_29605:672-1586(+)
MPRLRRRQVRPARRERGAAREQAAAARHSVRRHRRVCRPLAQRAGDGVRQAAHVRRPVRGQALPLRRPPSRRTKPAAGHLSHRAVQPRRDRGAARPGVGGGAAHGGGLALRTVLRLRPVLRRHTHALLPAAGADGAVARPAARRARDPGGLGGSPRALANGPAASLLVPVRRPSAKEEISTAWAGARRAAAQLAEAGAAVTAGGVGARGRGGREGRDFQGSERDAEGLAPCLGDLGRPEPLGGFLCHARRHRLRLRLTQVRSAGARAGRLRLLPLRRSLLVHLAADHPPIIAARQRLGGGLARR